MAQKQSKEQKKLLILGSSGMLAADLINVFKADKKYRLTAWDRADLDITSEEMVNKKISRFKPDIIINAAAYTAVDKCEADIEAAMAVNGYALRFLAETASKIGALLVHYSTDYIFDGENPKGYVEDAEPNPVNAYGQSKFAGEQMILMTAFHNSGNECAGCGAAAGCHKITAMRPLKYYLIRTSWLYGKNGPPPHKAAARQSKNFVDTMVYLGQKLPELKVVNDQRGKPTYAADLAKATKNIIESNLPFGIYHFTNETDKKGISWYDFAKEIFKIKKIKIKVKPVTTKEFYSGNKNYLAERPRYSMLVNTKLPKARDWKAALKDYLLGRLASK